jgi:glycosyltransferase involved in cell wall biosynthesis
LVIASHVVHYRYGARLYAYGPYALEIDIWADLFQDVVIAAPCRDELPPGDCLPFTRRNICVAPQLETGGTTLRAKLEQIVVSPLLAWRLCRVMHRADAIHVRCPGNLGLLGAIFAPLFSRYLVAKYSGQWGRFPHEPWSWKLQRHLLASRWWRGPVTVYARGERPDGHVVPFFTSILSDDQMVRAREALSSQRIGSPLRVLYVGRLSAAKNVDVLIQSIAELKRVAIPVTCTVIGEGPERPALERLAWQLGVRDRVEFVGGIEFTRVIAFYERADVLVLVSETEGWPKAIVEAMAFGVLCIGSNRCLTTEILGEGRGLVAPPGDARALTDLLTVVASEPQTYRSVAIKGALWAQRFTIDRVRAALHTLLEARWGVSLETLKHPVDNGPYRHSASH